MTHLKHNSPTHAETSEQLFTSFPVALRLTGKNCLLVGNSAETEKRAVALLAAGAVLTIVTPNPNHETIALFRQGKAVLHTRPFTPEDLDGCWLVVFCEFDAALASQIGDLCNERRIFFCAIDQPEPSSFGHLALACASSLFVAVGTSGGAPALASRLRKELQRVFDESDFAKIVDKFVRLRRETPPKLRREVLLREAARVTLTGRIVESVTEPSAPPEPTTTS